MRRLLTIAALALIGVAAVGCQGFNPSPPPGYVAAHEKIHNAAGYVYKTFERDHPNLAQNAKDLYDSEGILIQKGKANQPVPETPMPTPVETQPSSSADPVPAPRPMYGPTTLPSKTQPRSATVLRR